MRSVALFSFLNPFALVESYTIKLTHSVSRMENTHIIFSKSCDFVFMLFPCIYNSFSNYLGIKIIASLRF